MKRKPRQEPARCICEGGADRAKEHGKPGAKAPFHLNPKCPHSELALTTSRAPKKKTITRIRLQ